MFRISPSAPAVLPSVNTRKVQVPFIPGNIFDQKDAVTIAPSPKFGMFRRTSQQSTLTPDQQSALDAARNGRVDILENIYQRTKSYDFLTGADQEQQNILHRAARGNHESIIDYWKKLYDLLPNISDDMYSAWGRKVAELIHDRDNRQRTPLHWAAMNGHKAIILNLLSAHAPVDDLDEQLQSAADLAENAGHREIAQILRGKMNKSFTDNVKDSFTNFVQELADSIPANILDNTNKASTNTTRDTTPSPRPNINSPTPNNDINADLRRLIAGRHSRDNERRVQNLLQQGANPNEQDKQDWRTALHWAAVNGHDTYVNLILKHNPDLALTDRDGYTALTLAENQLKNLGRGRTPLRGEKKRRENVIRYLKKAYKQAKLVSSGESSPTIPPSSPTLSAKSGVSNNTKQSLTRRRSSSLRRMFSEFADSTPERFKRIVKEVAKDRKISLGSPSSSRSSSPTRKMMEKFLEMLEGKTLNVNAITTKQLTVENGGDISLPSAESRNVMVTPETIQSIKDNLINLQDEEKWQNRMGQDLRSAA